MTKTQTKPIFSTTSLEKEMSFIEKNTDETEQYEFLLGCLETSQRLKLEVEKVIDDFTNEIVLKDLKFDEPADMFEELKKRLGI